MAAAATAGGRLWRYNYAILMGGGYWILVLPVAASQVVTLWMMALASDFSQATATRIAELMTPILGAFLAAHSMAPEYRSGIGAVLACKPVSLHRVVTMRVAIALLMAVLLVLVTLTVCSVGLKPIEVWPPLLASLPGLWFLSMLALTFATLFRSALGGFAVAAVLWVLDVTMGYAVHPLLSVQGYSAMTGADPLGVLWLWSKAVLAVAGTVLLFIHGRLLPRVCRPPESRDVTRVTVRVAAVLALYCATGAAATVGYAYLNRGNLTAPDVTWLRARLGVYGPVPVARLFGPAFTAYVSNPPASDNTGLSLRRTRLEQALQRWPRSMWADGIAFALATEQEQQEPEAAAEAYLAVADRYEASPFAAKALVRIVRSDAETITPEERLRAARRLLAEYSHTAEAERGAELLLENYPDSVAVDEMLKAAVVAAKVAPPVRRLGWLVTEAELLATLGRTGEARPRAEEALALGRELRRRATDGTPDAAEYTPHLGRIDGDTADAEALLKRLGGG